MLFIMPTWKQHCKWTLIAQHKGIYCAQ